jgi:hypothetical protein
MSASAAVVAASPRSERHIWTFPGAPLSIHVDLTVVARLAAEAATGSDSQGLLLGKQVRRGLAVDGYRPVESGPLEAALEGPDPALRRNGIVGAYAIQRGRQIALGQDHVRLMERYLSRPTDVFLVVRRPADGEPAAGGFFFWEGERIFSEFSFLEFPLDAPAL